MGHGLCRSLLGEVFEAELGSTTEVGAAGVTRCRGRRAVSGSAGWLIGWQVSAGRSCGGVFAHGGHHVLHRGIRHSTPGAVGGHQPPAGFFEDWLVGVFAHVEHVAARLVRLGRDRFGFDELSNHLAGGRPDLGGFAQEVLACP